MVVTSIDASTSFQRIISGGEESKYRIWDFGGRQLFVSPAMMQTVTTQSLGTNSLRNMWSEPRNKRNTPNSSSPAGLQVVTASVTAVALPPGPSRPRIVLVGSHNAICLCDASGWTHSVVRPGMAAASSIASDTQPLHYTGDWGTITALGFCGTGSRVCGVTVSGLLATLVDRSVSYGGHTLCTRVISADEPGSLCALVASPGGRETVVDLLAAATIRGGAQKGSIGVVTIDVFATNFVYNGDLLVSASKDNTCRLWKSEEGEGNQTITILTLGRTDRYLV
eukprot:Clim_evm95s109 gene=Clim_evmTU95s109